MNETLSPEVYNNIKNNEYARVVLSYQKMIHIHKLLLERVSQQTYVGYHLLIKICDSFDAAYGEAAFDFEKTLHGIRPTKNILDLLENFIDHKFLKSNKT